MKNLQSRNKSFENICNMFIYICISISSYMYVSEEINTVMQFSDAT